VGKWITHNLALRLSYDINRSHSYLDGLHLNRPDCQFLFKDNPAPDANGYYPTTFMYHNLHGEVLLSVIDFINGYYDDRFYTPVITLGMGVACISEHTFVTQTFIEDGFKHNRNFEPSANIGLINNFKMNKNFDLVFTAMMTGTRFSIDSWGYELDDETIGVRSRVVDFNYSMSLGLTWNISGSDEYGSRIYELPHNYSNEMREMRERIRNLENELDDCLRYRPTDTVYQIINTTDTVQEIVSFPFSVFFHIDSYQLMSKRDLVNLREIAKVAMEKGWKIRLRGSCDSATATPEYNQRLSENRCNKIKLELMDMGVPESQFILVPVGGVKELDPTEYDRRVLIELVKELK
jgi:outer membrane protein OmpA-like peptidoglycan-associated protein